MMAPAPTTPSPAGPVLNDGSRATYSPDDNKLRLYPRRRLDAEIYARVKAAGFKWAPRQELFVAPTWSPEREDLLAELCGQIDDEDTSLAERQEARAERFEEYQEKRAADAHAAGNVAQAVSQRFEFGQPILVGHHSEKKARKDKERIDAALHRAVKMWKTSEYWERRAAGALAHAKYKELPAVRARRIKGIEADRRKVDRTRKQATDAIARWNAPGLDRARALAISGGEWGFTFYRCYPLAEFPRQPPASQYEGEMSLWSALDDRIVTPEWARDHVLPACHRSIERCDRWLEHYDNRLAYERAMLGEAGGLPADRFGMEPGGQICRRGKWHPIVKVNRRDGQVVSVTVIGHFATTVTLDEITDYRPPAEGDAEKVAKAVDRGPMCNYPGAGFVHMTAAEWKALPRWSDGRYTENHKATETSGRHRTKCRPTSGFKIESVFITDAKRVDPPAPSAAPAPVAPLPMDTDAIRAESDRLQRANAARAESEAAAAPFKAMEATLKAGGVVAVSATQLFPTPPATAEVMVAMADIQPTDRILEPSAGTGNLLRAIIEGQPTGIPGGLVAVEVNQRLADGLKPLASEVICADFLELDAASVAEPFDVILMNPPFADGQDVAHIRHALRFLKPGGRLVAICGGGPRQEKALKPLVEKHGGTWEPLPPDTFKESGTSARAVLLSIVI